MINVLDSFFAEKSPIWIASFCSIFVIIVAIIDHITGYELSFSIFYGIPVAIASWYSNKLMGIIFSILSAIIWASIDYTSGQVYNHEWILFWNMGVRLGFYMVISILLAELKIHLEFEKKLARTDALTGIMNAHAFREAVNNLLGIAVRYQQPYSIGYIDLDNFKQVNDISGHNTGDQVLKTVGTVLSKNIRTSDLAGRLGGDEFAVLLPLTDTIGTKEVFGNIKEQLLIKVKEKGWPIGFSAGIAIFINSQVNSEEAFKKADELMYRVKKSGKNDFLYQEF